MKNPYSTDELVTYLQHFWARAEGLEYGHEHEIMKCAAERLQRLSAHCLRLERRIRKQRIALRENWQIVEQRAQYKRAWYPSKLLSAILGNRRAAPGESGIRGERGNDEHT